LWERIVKSKLALRGMTIKGMSQVIHENYNSVYDVLHGKWGKKGKVARLIRRKVARYLDILELSKGGKK